MATKACQTYVIVIEMHVVRQMAHETLKIASVKHAVVFADGAPEAKNAQTTSDKQHF